MGALPPIEQPNSGMHLAGDTLEAAVASMARVGGCWSPSFSPDGSRLAFISDLNGIPQVWTVPSDGGWPDLVTTLDDQVAGVVWSPDGAWLALSLAPGGGMNTQIYVIRPDGTGLRRLTDGGRENNWLGRWTRDSSALLIASNRRSPTGLDAYLVDMPGGTMRLIAENRGIGYLTDVSRDGGRAILYRMVSRGDSDLFLLDLARGTETRLTPHEGPSSFHSGRFSPDGRTVYLASDRDRELLAFARIVVDEQGHGGPIEVIAARDDAELSEYALNDDGTLAALLWNVAGRHELVLWDLTSGASFAAPALPAELAADLTFSRDGRLLALTQSGARAPQDIWVLDLAARRFRQVTHSPHAGVVLDHLVRPELVRFAAHDGLALSGWLYRPEAAAAPGPLVLSFHGGPEGQEQPTFRSDYQALLAHGIAVFAPNVRGSSGFGKTFVNLDNGVLRHDAIRDIKSCVDYVVANAVADPGRIGIMGGSYGGYMTMVGLTSYPEHFAAGANLFGVVNFETFFAHTEPWMAAISTVKYGDPQTEIALLRTLSPIHRIDRVVAPTLVLHGANDTNVPVVEAEQVVESLLRRGVAVEYILFPDEGHGFRKQDNRIRATTAIVRWFVQHLRHGEP